MPCDRPIRRSGRDMRRAGSGSVGSAGTAACRSKERHSLYQTGAFIPIESALTLESSSTAKSIP